jgi:hypothetical protein
MGVMGRLRMFGEDGAEGEGGWICPPPEQG